MTDRTQYSKRTSWKDLGVRIKASIIAAFASLSCGWLLTFLAFFLSENHTVDNSILFILGESLVFTGSVLGISVYVNEEGRRLRQDLTDMIKNR